MADGTVFHDVVNDFIVMPVIGRHRHWLFSALWHYQDISDFSRLLSFSESIIVGSGSIIGLYRSDVVVDGHSSCNPA